MNPFCQLTKLIISLTKKNANDNTLKKNDERSHSYNGFAFNVTRSFLDTYDPIYIIQKFIFRNFNRPLMLDHYLVSTLLLDGLL